MDSQPFKNLGAIVSSLNDTRVAVYSEQVCVCVGGGKALPAVVDYVWYVTV